MNRLGVIVEGAGEIKALQNALAKLREISSYEILTRPIRADMQPKASAKVIAASARKAVEYLAIQKKVGYILVLIDREDHHSAAKLAEEIKMGFESVFTKTPCKFKIVVKDWCIENWLIADVDALEKMRGRFKVNSAFRNAVENDKADSVKDPIALLNSVSVNKRRYEKGTDPELISIHQDPERVGENSRSYRKFLKEIGWSAKAKKIKNLSKKQN